MGGKAGEGCVWSRIAQRQPRQQHITARFIALANSFISNLEFGYTIDRGSLPFEQNGPKEDIDDLRVVVRICPL